MADGALGTVEQLPGVWRQLHADPKPDRHLRRPRLWGSCLRWLRQAAGKRVPILHMPRAELSCHIIAALG